MRGYRFEVSQDIVRRIGKAISTLDLQSLNLDFSFGNISIIELVMGFSNHKNLRRVKLEFFACELNSQSGALISQFCRKLQMVEDL